MRGRRGRKIITGTAQVQSAKARERMAASRVAETGCGDGGAHSCQRYGEADSRD